MGAVDGVDDEVGTGVDVVHVDGLVGRHDDNRVGPEDVLERLRVVARPGCVLERRDVGVVVQDARAAADEPGDHVSGRRVAGVADVRLERHAEDADSGAA